MLLERLQKQTDLSYAQMERLASSASRRYKIFPIPKRNGETRWIEQPSREIKALQRWLVRALFVKLPLHPAATAYAKGASIKLNAERHLYSRFTVRLDFENFFPSFREQQILSFLTDKCASICSERDRSFVARIVCRNGGLTIGAPSSPAVTNSMMYGFDSIVAHWCELQDLIYTRYADDIFISANEPHRLSGASGFVEETSANYGYANLSLNKNKTAHLSKKYNRTITGLVITSDNRLSIGLKRKNKLKADLYKYSKGSLAPDDVHRVRGFLAFVRDVEADFYNRLKLKYATSIHAIEQIAE